MTLFIQSIKLFRLVVKEKISFNQSEPRNACGGHVYYMIKINEMKNF